MCRIDDEIRLRERYENAYKDELLADAAERSRLPGMHRWAGTGKPYLDCGADFWASDKCTFSEVRT